MTDDRDLIARDLIARSDFEWPDFRGAHRQGMAGWLPDELPAKAEYLWTTELSSEGIGGVAAAQGVVIVGGRDKLDRDDVWQCFDAVTGKARWQVRYPARGELDYGNSPRATPVIGREWVWLMGAQGHLHCVSLTAGLIEWSTNLAEQFRVAPLKWGHSGTPLVTEDRMIVQPGGSKASIVALDPLSGKVLWTTPGAPAGYASCMLFEPVPMHRQIVAYDEKTLGGWDVSTGKRLWTVAPRNPGDFNVPTPLFNDGALLLVTENNGARKLSFTPAGVPDPIPTAANPWLAPDTSSVVVSAGKLFGLHNGLHCLDVRDDLKQLWIAKERMYRRHGSLIASDQRVLVLTFGGELVLLDSTAPELRILGRLKLTEDKSLECWSHPALAQKKLFVRLSDQLVCLDLEKR